MKPATGPGAIKLIGVGNRWRGDDGAGLIAVRRVRHLAPKGVEVMELEGEPVALLDAWEGAGSAFVLDAVSSGAEPGTVHRVDAHAQRLPEPLVGSSTHALGLADAIGLGRALDRLPRRLIVYGIEGECFDAGARLSPAVSAAIDGVAAAVVGELRRLGITTWSTRRRHRRTDGADANPPI